MTALVHPWDSTALIGLPGRAGRWFSCRGDGSGSPGGWPLFALSATFAGFVVAGFFIEPPDASEFGSAVFAVVPAAALLAAPLWWWPRGRVRPKGPMRGVRAKLDGDTAQWDFGLDAEETGV
ncbi:hypothetical protein ACFFRC_45710, partial [Amycolatopsis halotolerans]